MMAWSTVLSHGLPLGGPHDGLQLMRQGGDIKTTPEPQG